MNEANVTRAKSYYKALNDKDMSAVSDCLHPEVQFVGPLATLSGKEAVFAAVTGFAKMINNLTVRTMAPSGDQVLVVYDTECDEPEGSFRAAAALTFKDGLIAILELFYDSVPFEEKKEEIFGK